MIMRFVYLCVTLLLFAVSCASPEQEKRTQEMRAWMAPGGKIKALCTLAMVRDLVQEVGGDQVDCVLLIDGELDPHSYELVKGDAEKFVRADMIFYVGLGLEHGASLAKQLQDNLKAYALGDSLRQTALEGEILHVNGQTDPHVWMDMNLWAATVPAIVRALSEKDPDHAVDYRARGVGVQARLLSTHSKILEEMARIPSEKRYLVTSHDAFHYFARAYLATDEERENESWRQRCAAPEGLAPESELSLRDIQKIVDHVLQYRVTVLFPESNLSKDSIRKIVDAVGHRGLVVTLAPELLYGDAMGPPGSDGDTYEKMIFHNARIMQNYWRSAR